MSKQLAETIRKRLEKETGTIYKPHAANIRFALAFPNTYYTGMSNLGFQVVYRMLNETEGAVCERVFLPDADDMADLLRTNEPLITMESQMPVRNFDVLAFSISYELDYLNVLKMLSLSKISELPEERGQDQPLVIAGGAAVTFNPETLAPFFDAFIIGEAEELIKEMVEILRRPNDRDAVLEALAQVEGIYIPKFYHPSYKDDGTLSGYKVTHGAPERIRRRWVRNLNLYNPASVIQTPETEFSNMILAEIARGCGRQCRFCVAGHIYRPPRPRSPESVLSGIKASERSARQTRVGLVSASVFDHPSSLLICQSLIEQNRLFSISSTRLDTLNRDIVGALHAGGHETLTLAPEAGSERLRLVINKPISDEAILNAAAIAWDGGFRSLKLYFMVGLPTEETKDVHAIIHLVTKIAEAFKWRRLIVSASCFVPKPWTPFQWCSMEHEKELSEKLTTIRRALRTVKHVNVSCESAREAVLQGIFARGDRRLKEILLLMHREGLSWRKAFENAQISPEFYAHRQRHKDEIFPWDHIHIGVAKAYLWAEYERAMIAAPTEECLVGICRRCGVCHT
ncbi:MAG: TIGR03960 family B12-binding radical SAM protein [Armatimonadetes bacterium]|nr:TIGR03960 family B12-binding radical SAM protein [Armatimonadota bacterium]